MPGGQVLYRKYRPQRFADLVNQEHIKQTLLNEIKLNKISHAYLFAGPRGTGKTTMARLLAKAVNCLNNQAGEPCCACKNCLALAEGRMLDLIEIDAASHTGVDDVRDLIEKVNLAPAVSKYKVYIIDEAHMLSKNAFNALLKTLEEPPQHVIFILATTEVNKLLPTIVSRCQYFDFHHLSWEAIINHLKEVASKEEISITDEAIATIAESAEGSLRDALSVLDQVASLGIRNIDRTVLEELLGIVDVKVVRGLTQAILDQNVAHGIEIINDAYYRGYDLGQLLRQWMIYVRELMMVSLGNGDLVAKSEDEKSAMLKQVKEVSCNVLINLLQRLAEASNRYKVANVPQLALEMVIFTSVKALPSDVSFVPNAVKGAPLVPATSPDQMKPATSDDKFWLEVCQKISTSNLALGSLLKNSRVSFMANKMIIELPSEFLKDVVKKPPNLQIISGAVKAIGKDLEIELTATAASAEDITEKVAAVFDIIRG